MKKKPELFKKTGKSSLTLRNFLNNLKENDLHYENKHITQCVFLGVLRLKPVPSIFSNNVPSVSTAIDESKYRRNSTSNKDVFKKDNINKVLSGKVSKKDPQKVKAAVKKVPSRRPSINFKLSTKKNMYEAEPSTSNTNQEIAPNTVSPDSIIARTTLNPIPTKFNPVQNLFDKLKQRRDESHSEPGLSKITLSNMTKEGLKSATVKYKVCKINANGQNNLNTNIIRKLKRTQLKKSYERLPLPIMSTSPITVSDSESTDIKDKDDVILFDENNSNNSYSSKKGRVIVEDIIIVKDDSLPKNKGRTSPRNKMSVFDQKICGKEESNVFNPTVVNVYPEILTGLNQCQEIIIISDEPKQTSKPTDEIICSEKQRRKDVIVIDEVREARVSPRLRKTEDKAKENTVKTEKRVVDEMVDSTCQKKLLNKVSEIDLQKNLMDTTKTQELNVAKDCPQNEKKEKTSPRLLKIIETHEKMSLEVKKELIESEVTVVNEKPKRQKNTMKSATLLPPMLLNAPMLLRSELAPKKKSLTVARARVKRNRNKMRKSLRNTSEKYSKAFPLEELSQHQERLNLSNIQPTPLIICEKEKQSNFPLPEVICLCDSSKNKNVNIKKVKKHGTQQRNANYFQNYNVQKRSKNVYSKLAECESATDNIILNQEKTLMELKAVNSKDVTRQKIKIFNKTSISEVVSAQEENAVIVKEEHNLKEKVSPRLLRSDFSKERILENSEENHSNFKEILLLENVPSPIIKKSATEINESVSLKEELGPNKRVSPRTLNKKNTNQQPVVEKTIVKKDESQTQKNMLHQKQSYVDISEYKTKKKQMEKTKQVNLDEILIVSENRAKKQGDKSSQRLLRSEMSQLKTKEKVPVKTKLKEVVVLRRNKNKQKQISSISPVKSNIIELPCGGSEDVNVVMERRSKSLRSDTVRKVYSDRMLLKAQSPRIRKVNSLFLSNSPTNRKSDIDNLQTPLQKNSEQRLKEISPAEVEKQALFRRFLRSEITRKEPSKQKRSKNNLSKQVEALKTSKKIVASEKKGRSLIKKVKSTLKTSMLLRSELAQLKNVASYIKPSEKKITKKPKSKMDNVDISTNNEPLLDDTNSTLVLQIRQKEKYVKSKAVVTQTDDGNKGITLKSGKPLKIISSKKSTITSPSQDIDSEIFNSSENHQISEVLNGIKQNRIVSEKIPVIPKKNKNVKNNLPRKNDRSKNDIKESSPTEVTLQAIFSRRNSLRSRKNLNKRKGKVRPDQELKLPEKLVNSLPKEIQECSETCDITSKTVDITVFDFNESEPEVLPLRLNNTPKKEKSTASAGKEPTSTLAKGNITPRSRRQKLVDKPVTKAQTKAKILSTSEEKLTQKSNPDLPTSPDMNKTISIFREKTDNGQVVGAESSHSPNKNFLAKQSKNKKTSLSKQSEGTPKDSIRTSTSPLKQTTITDLFQVLKKEKTPTDSIFGSAPKETQSGSQKGNSITDMPPPPRVNRKSHSVNEKEEEEAYDDSDCESRLEWIPEEYAEYKFKYSAKKMMTYKPIHKCKICLLILPTYYKLSKHKEEHVKKENPYNCKHCDKEFSNIEDLTAHLRIHKGKLYFYIVCVNYSSLLLFKYLKEENYFKIISFPNLKNFFNHVYILFSFEKYC